MRYCGEKETVGHNDYRICGEKFWDDIYQCDKCKLKQLQALTKEFAEGIYDLAIYSGVGGEELIFIKAQQYLDSIKE